MTSILKGLSSSSSGSINSGSLKAPGDTHITRDVSIRGAEKLHHLDLVLMSETMVLMAEPMKIRNLLKHDYTLLQIADGQYIKAEKGGESAHGRHDAGISLELLILADLDKNYTDPKDLVTKETAIRFRAEAIPLGKGGEEWTVAKFVALLSEGDPDYDLLGDNCWKFAFSSAEGVLQWCVGNALDLTVRSALMAELAKLRKVERLVPKEVLDAVRNPTTVRASRALEKVKQNLKNKQEQLPEDSKIRKTGYALLHKVLPSRSTPVEEIVGEMHSGGGCKDGEASSPCSR